MPSATRQQRVKRDEDAVRGRTRTLNNARHVQHVIFVDNDAYAVRGVGPELIELADKTTEDSGRDRLHKTHQ